jgi:uncharacterized membrane protein YfcA
LAFTLLIFALSIVTAIFGVLTGLGGGILIVPILSFLHIDLRYAMGVSLVSVIALSLITATTQSSQQLLNPRVGIFLETAAVIGALCGAALLPFLSIKFIAIAFGLILISIAHSKKEQTSKLNEQTENKPIALQGYPKKKLSLAWLAMGCAGILSGILGIGSGALKVLAMERILGLPYRISTATSNFMVGITAATSIGLYLRNNYLSYDLILPVILGVYCGSKIGAKLLLTMQIQVLKKIFSIVIYILAIQMLYKGYIA